MRANRRMRLGCSWLAPLMMVGLVACCCPKPDPVNPSLLTPEQEKAQLSVVKSQLDTAQNKGEWSPDDEAKFSASIATLSKENRLELSKDLVTRLNSDDNKKLKLVHPRPAPGLAVCPGLCDSGVKKTTTQTVPSVPSVPRATGKADAK